MAKLSEHQSGEFVKLLFIGDSGTGKTGAMTSLVKEGYNLRILDLDNGLDALRQHILSECPNKIDNVEFITLRDKIRAGQSGPLVTPQAYVKSLKLRT